ncbi:M15 family metallopeptidase [Actinospongicola halichondriae]|uniref:M15 family metallopeptidase n=1 Tax=Actinospongicola halichondriae TaxID=3236844 RepID=UPI003D590631
MGGRRTSAVLAVACIVAVACGIVAVRSLPDDAGLVAERSPDVTTTVRPEPTTTTTTTSSTTTTSVAEPAPTVTTTAPPLPTSSPAPAVSADGTTLLVWTSGGLPPGFATDVQAIPQVTASTVVLGDLLRLVGTDAADGSPVDRTRDGWAFPIDAFAVDPGTYAAFQPSGDAATLRRLTPGGAVLTESSAIIRRIGVGGVLRFAGGDVTVTGIVADESGGGAEAIVHRDDAGRLGIDDARFLLVADSDRSATLDAIRARTPSGEFLSLRGSDQTRWLRHGDRVEPQALVKRVFGEFTFRDTSGRDVQIDPAWVSANIVTTTVPLLGRIRCHRTIIPMVRAAMEDLERSGRGDTVQAENYAGCQYARRIAPGSGLSRHSWGLALDLNIGADPRGTFASQDPALVEAMTSRGFSWGGEWEYPDPGHYEFVARPA